MRLGIDEVRARVEDLRQLYLNATPEQRFKVARSVLDAPSSLSVVLITHVSAIEGVARAFAIDLTQSGGTSREACYKALKFLSAVPLIRDHVAPHIAKSPEDLFGADDWALLDLATDARNYLVHEAGTLRAGWCDELIGACERVLNKLAEVSGVRL